MIRDGDEVRICYTCSPPHAENCGTCFGFGVNHLGVPIAAGEVELFRFTRDWKKCPECSGTPYNNHFRGEIEIPAEGG